MLDGVGDVDGLGTEVSWYTSDGSEHGQGAPPQKIVSEQFASLGAVAAGSYSPRCGITLNVSGDLWPATWINEPGEAARALDFITQISLQLGKAAIPTQMECSWLPTSHPSPQQGSRLSMSSLLNAAF